MKAISEYIYTVFIVSVSGGIMLLIAPKGQGDGIRRAYRYLISLAIVLALISPLHDMTGLFSSLDLTEITQETKSVPIPTSDLARESAVSEVERQIGNAVCTMYGCPATVRLTVAGDNDNIAIVSAVLRMDADESTVDDARTYLSRLLDCTVTVEPVNERKVTA